MVADNCLIRKLVATKISRYENWMLRKLVEMKYSLVDVFVIKKTKLFLSNVLTDEGGTPTVHSLLSWDYVHRIVPNELWISWKEFAQLAYCCWDIAFLRHFQAQCCDPPQGRQKNWVWNFDLKLCIETDLNENSLLRKFPMFWLFLFWNNNIGTYRCIWAMYKHAFTITVS